MAKDSLGNSPVARGTFLAYPEEIDPDKYVIALYYVEPNENTTLEEAGREIASEESIGTWTEIKTLRETVLKYAAKVYKIKRVDGSGLIYVAFPLDLIDFEGGISHLLSIVAGNLFGLSSLRNVRLLDLQLPKDYVKNYRGPKFGIKGVRELVSTIREPRPHLGTIVKPKVGLNPKETAEVAYEAAIGGVDFIKDDETLTNQKFNPIEDRVSYVMEKLDLVREETDRRVIYAVNITSDYGELFENAERALSHGANALMVDVIVVGFPALRALAEDPSIKVPIHVHRCMHAAMTRNPKHGVHMMVIAKLVRLAGGDQLHTGTAVGKMEKPGAQAQVYKEWGGVKSVRRINDFLRSEWYELKPVMPVASGGIHPAIVPSNLEALGSPDIQINAGGGIHGHPWGTRAGAKAMVQAIEAYLKGIPLEEYAKEKPELREALKYWGYKFLNQK
ncbi:MAG: ribulose 1,5-bisphosphate carboxylase [Thermofilum sp. ex4484_15]|nr:MAG: ribulose 1,5-bisphosphate carboxylase [Thermofilum sp. ex4484_15]